MEPAMGRIESVASEAVNRIRKEESLTLLSNDDRAILALFVAVQHLRTQQFRANILEMDRQLQAILTQHGDDIDNIRNYSPLRTAEDGKIFAISTLPNLALELAPHILDKEWLLLRTGPARPFIIGDNPVALDNQRDFGFYGNIGFAVPGIEIYMPLSDTLSLYLICKTHRNTFDQSAAKLEELKRVAPESPEVKGLEERLGPMFAALREGAALRADPQVVLRHNSLQVHYAERWHFSPEQDFQLATRMIAENPKVKRGPRGEVN